MSLSFLLQLMISFTAFGASLGEACRTPATSDTPLSRAFDQAISRFATREARALAPRAYVEALDAVLANSPYAELLNCQTGLPYELAFQDPQNGDADMFVSADYGPLGEITKIELSLNLVKPVSVALFTYLHELVHVCQKRQSQDLLRRYFAVRGKLKPRERYYYSTRKDAHARGVRNLEYEAAEAVVARENYVGEIEAFHAMYLAYLEFIPQGLTRLCTEPSYRHYAQMEADLVAGQFAQTILNSYSENDADPALYIPESSLRSYFDGATGQNFLMRRLNDTILEFITKLGIPYRETDDDSPK